MRTGRRGLFVASAFVLVVAVLIGWIVTALAVSSPPAPLITSGPVGATKQTTATFNYFDTQSGVKFQCKLDNASFSSCANNGVTYKKLADGSHTFQVQALQGKNTSSPATRTWTVDTKPPVVAFTFPQNGHTYTQSAYATGCSGGPGICGTASDLTSVASVKLAIFQNSSHRWWNGSSFTANSAVIITATGTTSWRLPLANPAASSYIVFAQAADGLGNASQLSQYDVFTITASASNTIAATAGTPQFTKISTSYGTALEATVRTPANAPIAGVVVTFTAPASGATGTFASCAGGNPTLNSCVVTTNASGVATASTLTASSTTGSFSVNATTPVAPGSATFSLINSANFSILDPVGGITPPLVPGASVPLNLRINNPNPTSITIAIGGLTIAVHSTTGGCGDGNFAASSNLVALTIPGGSTVSLSSLTGSLNWPVLEMLETGHNQNACRNASVTLTYGGSATG
jgi:hypothetical protein